MATAPAGLLDDILELRAYARARETYQRACQMENGPEKRRVMADPLVQMVKQHDFAQAREEADGE